jgi:hypothetical protein
MTSVVKVDPVAIKAGEAGSGRGAYAGLDLVAPGAVADCDDDVGGGGCGGGHEAIAGLRRGGGGVAGSNREGRWGAVAETVRTLGMSPRGLPHRESSALFPLLPFFHTSSSVATNLRIHNFCVCKKKNESRDMIM